MQPDFYYGLLSRASGRNDPRDAHGDADEILDLNAIAGLEVIAHHGFGADACDMSLAVWILDVGEEDVPRDLAVDTDRLNLLQNAVARSFKHLSTMVRPPEVYPGASGRPLPPTEYPLEREKKRPCRVEPGDQPGPVFLHEPIEEVGRQMACVLREQCALHPLDDLVWSGQDMRIDDQPHDRILEAASVEQARVRLWRQDRLRAMPAPESAAKGLDCRELLSHHMGGSVVLRRDLERELPFA